MPWAINGQISTEVLPGGLEISEEQYALGLDGILTGKVISIDGGFAVIDPPEPEPEPEPEPTPPTVDDYQYSIQALVDNAARAKLFNDGVTLASYVASTIPEWAAQAQAFITWRDAVWVYAYAELAKVQAGERPQPTVAEFLTELPEIVWP